jgi:hypothetical protein
MKITRSIAAALAITLLVFHNAEILAGDQQHLKDRASLDKIACPMGLWFSSSSHPAPSSVPSLLLFYRSSGCCHDASARLRPGSSMAT